MRHRLSLVVILTSVTIGVQFAGAQTLYVPSGTSGIGTASNGNVGIGVASPAERLQVAGNLLISNGEVAAIYPSGHNLFFGGRQDYAHITYTYRPSWGTLSETYATIDVQKADVSGTFLTSARISSQGVSFFNGGSLGIGTASPNVKFEVKGTTGAGGGGGDIYANGENAVITADSGQSRLGLVKKWGAHPVIAAGSTSPIMFGHWSTEQLLGNIGAGTFAADAIIAPSGNVGIGTTNPTQKLSVNGTIRAKEVIVEASPWPDDVFAPGYDLPTVEEVAAHIAAEGHLPGVPSAATVAGQGVAVGEMQKTLLRKVEELTLYVIELERKNAALQSRLENENAELRSRLEKIEQAE